ncbi:Arm DNA-binding domain-containing protein [Pseudoalteromonas espejiana]
MLSINEAKVIAKKYTGVTIHGNAIRITFMYQGKRCLETLKMYL